MRRLRSTKACRRRPDSFASKTVPSLMMPLVACLAVSNNEHESFLVRLLDLQEIAEAEGDVTVG